MSSTFIQLPDQSSNTGSKVQTSEVADGAVTLAREILRIAGAALAEVADVKNTVPTSGLYGLVVRPIGPVDVNITGDSVGSGVESTDNTAIVCLNTKTMANGTTALVPKFAKINAGTNGNNTLVAAVTAKKIRVLSVYVVSSGTVNGKFQSAAAGTDLTGLSYMVVNSGFVLPFNPIGWFETIAGELLNLNLSAGVTVGGSLTYVEI